MIITYTGKLERLTPVQRKKWDAKTAKLGKLVDGRGEREVHVVLKHQRHEQRAEITVNLHDHTIAGEGSAADLLTAMTTAADKIEKQVRKLRTKRRDVKRDPEKTVRKAAAPEPAAPKAKKKAKAEAPERKKVYKANRKMSQKPLTLDEAMLAMEQGRDYVAYRDAETDRVSVLVRRSDGHFDLVES